MKLSVDYIEDTDLFDGSNDWPLEKSGDYPIGVKTEQSGVS